MITCPTNWLRPSFPRVFETQPTEEGRCCWWKMKLLPWTDRQRVKLFGELTSAAQYCMPRNDCYGLFWSLSKIKMLVCVTSSIFYCFRTFLNLFQFGPNMFEKIMINIYSHKKDAFFTLAVLHPMVITQLLKKGCQKPPIFCILITDLWKDERSSSVSIPCCCCIQGKPLTLASLLPNRFSFIRTMYCWMVCLLHFRTWSAVGKRLNWMFIFGPLWSNEFRVVSSVTYRPVETKLQF